MTSQEKTIILNVLSAGEGFARACSVLGKKPEELSIEIRKDDSFESDMRRAVQAGYTNLSNSYITETKAGEMSKATSIKQNMASFCTELALWECYCKTGEVNINKAITALETYRNKPDAAIACGMSLEGYMMLLSAPETKEVYMTYMQF